MDIAELRREYKWATLDETDVDIDPLIQFDHWLQQAIDAQVTEPTAMSLATIALSESGAPMPSSRIVLLKGRDQKGFVFFTNYSSRKGAELLSSPNAAMLFYWAELERQVRIEGRIAKISDVESDSYFASRPLGSKYSAWASPQSAVIESREWLEQLFKQASEQHGESPPRPPHWGGYRLEASSLEFWQGRSSRLHDRIRYRKNDSAWIIERLAP